MESSIKLHTIVFAGLYWISLLYCCGDISYQEIWLCVVNHSLQMYLSYSKNCLVFHPLCLEGFPKVHLVFYGWLIYMVELWSWFMWLIYLWYSYVANINIHMWMNYEIHNSWNCLIKLKFKHLWFFSNINKIGQLEDGEIIMFREPY